MKEKEISTVEKVGMIVIFPKLMLLLLLMLMCLSQTRRCERHLRNYSLINN